jgi:hypothetical protein
MRPKPNFDAPTEKIEKISSPVESVNEANVLINLIFNFKTEKKKSISRLSMKNLISLSKLFDLPSNAKCSVMKENLEALSEIEIKNKLSSMKIEVANGINSNSDKYFSIDDSI